MSALRRIHGGLGFIESPRWHDGRLWLVDFFSKRVLSGGLDGELETVAELDDMPGGLGFLPDGDLLVVSQTQHRILRRGAEGLTVHADLSGQCAGAANDMLVDAAGRCFVGHHGFDFFGGAEPRPASLLRVDPDGSVAVAAEDLIFPNGMALVDDGRTLVVAESFANRLTAFTLGVDGALSERRVWAPVGEHTPDGICADPRGGVWFGSPLSSAFVRVAEGGDVLETISTGEEWAVACCIAGEARDQLCCLTAATTLEDMPQGKSDASVSLYPLGADGEAS